MNMTNKLYAIVSAKSNQVVSRGGSSTAHTLRVFETLGEAQRSIRYRRKQQGEMKIVEFVRGRVVVKDD